MGKLLTGIGLLLTALGIVIPIGWDLLKTKSEITVAATEQAQIIGASQMIDGLHAIYAGQEIHELSKVILTVKNTGRTPILGRDVISPLHVDFEADSAPIDVKVVSSEPADLQPALLFVPGTKRVEIKFDLLNPDDQIWIAALFQTNRIRVTAGGRIAGVSRVLVAKPLAEPQVAGPRPAFWKKLLVGVATLLAAGISAAGLTSAAAERRTKLALREGKYALPKCETKAHMMESLGASFSFITPKEKKSLLRIIDTLSDVPDFSNYHREAILSAIQTSLDEAMPNLRLAMIFVVLTAAGIWYMAV